MNTATEMRAGLTPVTILTGFLGAGKTTILNRLLIRCDDMLVGVIENEFGDIGIDNQLVVGVEEGFVQLANGCMCCTVRGDLIRILHQWLDEGRRVDRVIIETTGIADPGPIAETFAADARLRDHYGVDGIITVVDAGNIAVQLRETSEARRQIAYADRLLVNKGEALGEDALTGVKAALDGINPLARQIHTSQGEVDPDLLFGLPRPDDFIPAPVSGHHHSDISSISFELAGVLNAPRFYRWMGDMLAFHATRLYRMKGILAIEGQDRRIILQGVRDLIQFSEGAPWGDAPRHSQLVLIGRGIDAMRSDAALHDCLARHDAKQGAKQDA